MKKFQIAGKRASESPAENFGAWKKIFGAGKFFSGARIFPSRRQYFGDGRPQKVKIPHKTLHKGAVLCKKCLFLFSVLPCKLKSRVREIHSNPAKRNSFRLRGDILPDRVSSDTVPDSAATDLGTVEIQWGRTVSCFPADCCDRFEIHRNKGLSVRRQNSSAL